METPLFLFTHGGFKQAISRAYSKLNFEQFCEVIGEPVDFHAGTGEPLNDYAMTKFNTFKCMAEDMSRLGTYLDKLVEYGIQDFSKEINL